MISLLPRGRVFVDQLKPGEAEALVEIHRDGFARAWSVEDFAALVADRTVFTFTARKESLLRGRRLVGFVLLRAVADEAEILTIAVRPSERGRGIGRLLMEDAMRRLYAAGIAALFLEVDRDNKAAVRLYKSLGFETVGERKGYYRKPDGSEGAALVMRVQLR